MSYHADHLAWQQRVAQEFKASAGHLDQQMFQSNGQWFNYPDLINYLKTSQKKKSQGNTRRFGGTQGNGFVEDTGSVPAMYQSQTLMSPKGSRRGGSMVPDDNSNYGYAPKSRLLYQNKRSKTGMKMSDKWKNNVGPHTYAPSQQKSETGSRLQKNNIQRFNEAYEDKTGPKSQARSVFSKTPKSYIGSRRSEVRSKVASTYSKQQMKMNIYQNVEHLDETELDRINEIIGGPTDPVVAEQEAVVEDAQLVQEEMGDMVEELPIAEDRLTSVSQLQVSPSQVSNMSGRTYISSLQKQLNEEKEARQNLESELDELKRISSEITSQLSAMQRAEQQKMN